MVRGDGMEVTEVMEVKDKNSELSEIPEFTKEDFLNSFSPYEFVFRYHDNRFIETRAIELVSQAARLLGIRNFKSMYADYLASIQQLREAPVQYTQFENQPFDLLCGDWTADDTGVWSAFGFGGNELVCPHPIMPVQRLINIDTGEEKIKIAFQKGRRWREIVVEKNVVASAQKIVTLSSQGVGVTSETAKLLVRYLSDLEHMNYDIIPEVSSFSRLGYFGGEGFVPFVDKLVFDGDQNFRSLYQSIASKGDRRLWMEEIKKVRAYSTAAKIVIAAAVASVLVPVCGAQVFFTHLWSSESGTGKTVALMCAASVWGDPELGKYIQTFNSTTVGQERYAAFLNHLPLMIDELQLGNREKFSVYQLAEGVGRTRGNKTGGVDRTPTWANSVITTGETPLVRQSDGAGAFNRTMDIECSPSEKVIEDGHATAAIIRNNYGFAGREFVELLFRSEDMQKLVREYFEEQYRALSKNDTTEKQAMAAALILTADNFFCDWILNTGDRLNAEDIAKHLASRKEVSIGERGYSFFCDWVGINAKRFICRSYTPESGEIYGVIGDDGYIYIIRSIFSRVAEAEGFNAKSLLSHFRENGLIATRGRNMTKGKRINGQLVECIAIRKAAGFTEEEETDHDFDDFI